MKGKPDLFDEASKASENPWATLSSLRTLNIDCSALTRLLAAAWEITTPFGLPVEPDV